ncbi:MULTISPECIES: DUF1372 family protein [Streptococcus]|uniref:DUF1372 family protein n=1 Tax=Streptococcus TaxID=1301 RepID=UPI00069D4665|nr:MULTISPECIES: DUF1372 family protein [Streptococcus]
MKAKGLYLALIALSLSMFNLGLIAAKHYYEPQIGKLEKQMKKKEDKKTVIIHQVDNAGGMMAGKITDKEIIDGRYTVTAGAYGKFLVTEEQYQEIEVGDDIPEYLKGRGN